eukprot:1788011-Amphidinium_carterae.1
MLSEAQQTGVYCSISRDGNLLELECRRSVVKTSLSMAWRDDDSARLTVWIESYLCCKGRYAELESVEHILVDELDCKGSWPHCSDLRHRILLRRGRGGLEDSQVNTP